MITSQKFADLFLSEPEKTYSVLFKESDAVGFSLLKDYPPEDNLLFQPVRNQRGETDSVALIKVYILPQKDKGKVVPLYGSIVSSSKYLLKGNMFYDYSDDNRRTTIQSHIKCS